MKDLDLELLLKPLSAELPCGNDMEYEPAFMELELKGAGKAEQQFGETIIPAQGPEWRPVHELAAELAAQTRDLRLAVWLIRSGARLQGLVGAAKGLTLLRGLIETHWDGVHPLLDADEDNDPTARLSAIAVLLDRSTGMADLRTATIAEKPHHLSFRDIELAWEADEPSPGEIVGSKAGIIPMLGKMFREKPEISDQMTSMLADVQAIDAALRNHLGSGVSPDMRKLKKLLQCIAEAATQGNEYLANIAVNVVGSTLAEAGGRSSFLSSRADIVSVIEKLCEWLEANEPGHPAPLFLTRASRLLSMSFVDIVRDLVPDSVPKLEGLAGVKFDKKP